VLAAKGPYRRNRRPAGRGRRRSARMRLRLAWPQHQIRPAPRAAAAGEYPWWTARSGRDSRRDPGAAECRSARGSV